MTGVLKPSFDSGTIAVLAIAVMEAESASQRKGRLMPTLRAMICALMSLVMKRGCEEEMDGITFFNTYYAKTSVPKDIPIRLRKIFVEQLGSRWKRVKPHDRPTDEDDELDFSELLSEIEHEFGIAIPEEQAQRMDGSFDGIVRYVARMRQ